MTTARAESEPEAPAPGEVRESRVPTGRFEVGAGFSTDDQFVLGAKVAQDDLFGTGMHLSLSASISARRQLFLMHFVDPTLLGSRLSLATDFYNDRRVMPGFTRQATGGTLTLSQALGEHLRGFVGYRLEHVTVTDDAAYTARATSVPLRDLRIASLRAGIEYSTLDQPVMPLAGTSIGGTIEVADSAIGSEVDLMRVKAWASHHRPLGPFVLHVGGTFESVLGPLGVPRSERLFLDGSSEVRGYAPGSLGPLDALGTPVGGNYKLTGRAELELPLSRRHGLSLVGFGDVGTIFDTSGRGSLGSSAGFGVLWRSPIGPLRFDIAFTPDGERHFVFGVGGLF